MSVIGSLNAVLSVDSGPWSKGLNTAGKDIAAFKNKTAGLDSLLSTFGGSLAPAALIASVGFMVKNTFSAIDAQTELAESLQLNVTNLGRLQYAAIQSGVDIDVLSTAVQQLETRLGNGSSSKALDKLGLSPDKLKALAPDQALLAIADAFDKVTVPADRAALAAEIFGKSGVKLLPFLSQGRDALLDFGDAAVAAGFALSDTAAGSISEADEAFNRLSASWDGLKNQFTVGLAPGLAVVADGFTMILDLSRRCREATVSMLGGIISLFSKVWGLEAGLLEKLGVSGMDYNAAFFDNLSEELKTRSQGMFDNALGVGTSGPAREAAPDVAKGPAAGLFEEFGAVLGDSAKESPLAKSFMDLGASAKAALGGALDEVKAKAGPAADKFDDFIKKLQEIKKEADDLTASLASPQETFQDGIARLDELVGRKLIDPTTFGRGAVQFVEQLQGTIGQGGMQGTAAIAKGSQNAFSAIAAHERKGNRLSVEDLLKAAGEIQKRQLEKQDAIVKELQKLGLTTVRF